MKGLCHLLGTDHYLHQLGSVAKSALCFQSHLSTMLLACFGGTVSPTPQFDVYTESFVHPTNYSRRAKPDLDVM